MKISASADLTNCYMLCCLLFLKCWFDEEMYVKPSKNADEFMRKFLSEKKQAKCLKISSFFFHKHGVNL